MKARVSDKRGGSVGGNYEDIILMIAAPQASGFRYSAVLSRAA